MVPEPKLQAIPHPRRAGAFLFPSAVHNIEGVGDICAAGVLPVLKNHMGELSVLLPEEDMKVNSSWAPGAYELNSSKEHPPRPQARYC